MPVLELLANCTNEPDVSLALKREDRKKIGPIESNMQLTVGRNSGRINIGNIKQVRICAPGKPNIQSLADRRMRAVATGQVGGRTYFQAAVRPFQMRLDTPARLFEIHEL